MKNKLFEQVIADNPEGMGGSVKGWNVVVEHLHAAGPHWAKLTARCARETTRDSLKQHVTVDKANQKKYELILFNIALMLTHYIFIANVK